MHSTPMFFCVCQVLDGVQRTLPHHVNGDVVSVYGIIVGVGGTAGFFVHEQVHAHIGHVQRCTCSGVLHDPCPVLVSALGGHGAATAACCR